MAKKIKWNSDKAKIKDSEVAILFPDLTAKQLIFFKKLEKLIKENKKI